jgi:cell division protein FtsQ
MATKRSVAAAGGMTAPVSGRIWSIFRAIFITFSAIFTLFAGLWLYWTAEEFVIVDSRFFLPGPPEPGAPSKFFRVTGARHASEQQITNVFSRDFGRSVYLLPIEERRRQLLSIDWVKEASINRFWPNRIEVDIRERIPVAFAQLQTPGNTVMYTLIDADGVYLDPQKVSRIRLPVLSGIPRNEPEKQRRERLRGFLRMRNELGAEMDKISEIDISDVDNIRIIQPFGGRVLTLMLGNQKFKERLEGFKENHEQILAQMPEATTMDLRLSRRITAAGSIRK